nr:hypothetical protein CFP56_14092 [Quercus suber]
MLQEFVVKEAFVGRRLLGDIFIQCCETKFSFLRQLYMFQVGEISGRFEKKGFSLKGTILLQCGTNLFAGGHLDCFNLSIDAAYSL